MLVALLSYVAVVAVLVGLLILAARWLGAERSLRNALARNGLDGALGIAVGVAAVTGVGIVVVAADARLGRYNLPFVFGTASFLAGIGLVGIALGKRRQYAVVANATPDTTEGPAIVSGEVQARETVEAPVSGSPCVAYDARIERRLSGVYSGASGGWLVDARRTDAVPFRIDGTAIGFDPEETVVHLAPEVVSGPDRSVPDAARRLLPDGVERDGAVYRVTERRVGPDDKLAAIGRRTAEGFEAAVITKAPGRLHESLRVQVRRNGPLGAVLAVSGYLAMLVGVGAL